MIYSESTTNPYWLVVLSLYETVAKVNTLHAWVTRFF